MSLDAKSINWRHIAGLGVGLVVAGQFAGWNYGLGRAGWADMMVATVLMGVLCFGLALCVAELATMMPDAGGLYIYSENAFGNLAGYAVGIALVVALAVGGGAAAQFISAYASSVLGFGGALFKLILFGVIIAIHIRGVGEALTVLLVAGFVAVISLLAFGGVMLPYFDVDNLLPNGEFVVDGSAVFACIPFAVMLFIIIEQTVTSAEEAADPERNVPLGLVIAIAVLALTAMCVLVLGPAAVGPEPMGLTEDPLLAAMALTPGASAMGIEPLIGVGAILGLVATLFSIIYSTSRQIFALARGGYLPKVLARQGRTGTPFVALIAVGLIGYPLSFVSPDKVILTMVLLLNAAYIVTLAAFIWLRRNRPDAPRRFHAPGGIVTALAAMILSGVVVAACISENPDAIMPMLVVFVLAAVWYWVGARPSRNLDRTLPSD